MLAGKVIQVGDEGGLCRVERDCSRFDRHQTAGSKASKKPHSAVQGVEREEANDHTVTRLFAPADGTAGCKTPSGSPHAGHNL